EAGEERQLPVLGRSHHEERAVRVRGGLGRDRAPVRRERLILRLHADGSDQSLNAEGLEDVRDTAYEPADYASAPVRSQWRQPHDRISRRHRSGDPKWERSSSATTSRSTE